MVWAELYSIIDCPTYFCCSPRCYRNWHSLTCVCLSPIELRAVWAPCAFVRKIKCSLWNDENLLYVSWFRFRGHVYSAYILLNIYLKTDAILMRHLFCIWIVSFDLALVNLFESRFWSAINLIGELVDIVHILFITIMLFWHVNEADENDIVFILCSYVNIT